MRDLIGLQEPAAGIGPPSRGTSCGIGTSISPRARVLALSCLAFVGALACTTPCREGASANDWHAFEHDQERCELQTSRLATGVDPNDYRACMRARGWCSAPQAD
jgi:hypothetical protein